MSTPDLDPRYEWIEVTDLGREESTFIQGPCRHIEMDRAEETEDGHVSAFRCRTCVETFHVIHEATDPDTGAVTGYLVCGNSYCPNATEHNR